MSVFDDENLKQWKTVSSESPRMNIILNPPKIQALLHRLDMAEKVCEAEVASLSTTISGTEAWNLILDALEAWNKSCRR